MAYYTLLAAAPLLALLAGAAALDLRYRRIPNWLTLGLVLTGMAQSLTGTGLVRPAQCLAGVAVGFALPLVLYLIGALGAGDVKLLAGVGAWLGPAGILAVFLTAAIVGLAMVLVQSLAQGRTLVLFRNSFLVAMSLAHLPDAGAAQTAETGRSCRSVDRPLPYAVPVLAATAMVLFWVCRMGR